MPAGDRIPGRSNSCNFAVFLVSFSRNNGFDRKRQNDMQIGLFNTCSLSFDTYRTFYPGVGAWRSRWHSPKWLGLPGTRGRCDSRLTPPPSSLALPPTATMPKRKRERDGRLRIHEGLLYESRVASPPGVHGLTRFMTVNDIGEFNYWRKN